MRIRQLVSGQYYCPSLKCHHIVLLGNFFKLTAFQVNFHYLLKRTVIAIAVIAAISCTELKGQSITTTDGVVVQPSGTATSSTSYSSGSISLSASVWESQNSAPSLLKHTIRNISDSKYSSVLLFDVDPGTIAIPTSINHTVRFNGVNTGLEAMNAADEGGIRFMHAYKMGLFGVVNSLGSDQGVVHPYTWSMHFGTNFNGAVGSLIPWNLPWSGGAPAFRNLLDDGNGNMGIGVAAPTAQLHTSGSVRFAGITNNNTTDRIVSLDVNGNLYYRDASSLGGGSWSSNAGNIYNANTGIVVIGTLPTAIPTGDNIKLAVNGSIYASKLKITQSGWADYVFDPTYKLRSLQEVESFIQKNSHLPEIPSSKEVEKDGMDIGNNQALLLKKIEELTLYIIDLNKKVEAQQKEIEALKK